MKFFVVLSCVTFFAVDAQRVFDRKLNDQCASHITGRNGTCMEPKNCEAFKTDKNKLKICSFDNKIPIVCCPNSVNIQSSGLKRISAKKCDEYSELNRDPSPSRLARSVQINLGKEVEYFPTFVGGTKAAFNEFPHMAAIGWTRDSNQIDWMCGGSLVSEKFVLSAAHCASVGRERPDITRIGDQNLLVNEPEISPQNFVIKNIIIHPQYKSSLKYHDIALFELNIAAIFTNDVFPACLSQSSIDPTEPVEAMGYGQTSFAGPQSNALLKGFLNIVNNTQCNLAYDEQSDLPQGIIQSQICAWDPEGNRDTCQGDSGGPLQMTKFTKSLKKYYVIIGVTSFGKFCAAGAAGVYTRVFSYLDWIESIVWRS